MILSRYTRLCDNEVPEDIDLADGASVSFPLGDVATYHGLWRASEFAKRALGTTFLTSQTVDGHLVFSRRFPKAS